MILKCREKHLFTEQFKKKSSYLVHFVKPFYEPHCKLLTDQLYNICKPAIEVTCFPCTSLLLHIGVAHVVCNRFFPYWANFWLVYMYRRTNEWCLIYLYLIDKSSCSQILLNSFLPVCVFVCMWGTERVWWGSGESFSRGN